MKVPKIDKRTLSRNAPKIFKVLGLIGLIGSTPLTVYSTVKAVRACDKRKEELGIEKLPAKEIVKTSWKFYIPVAGLMGASTASMIGGESISTKRTAVLSAAYTAAQQTLVDYKEEAQRQLGDKKAQEIERKVYETQAERAREELLSDPDLNIQCRDKGGTLFYEPFTGTFFYSTRNKVDRAFIDLSAQMIRENYVSLGDLFARLELRPVDACNMVGWNTDRCNAIEPDYHWCGIEESCTPYAVMGYSTYPLPGYDKII